MSRPEEEKHALDMAAELLSDLTDAQETPRVPAVIRLRARSVLRHFPGPARMAQIFADTAAKGGPTP